MKPNVCASPHQNRLLAALPAGTLVRLTPYLQPVELIYRGSLFQPGESLPDVYFPQSGIVSLVALASDGAALETGLVGREGMAPAVAFLGIEAAPQQGLIQAAGHALRMPATILREQAQEDRVLKDLLQAYTAAVLIQTAQVAVCNALHPIEARLARWLLLVHDRLDGDKMPMTQDFLGLMLGVRRASVTTTACVLQQAGLIRHHYGIVEILDRAGLEAKSCDCYADMRRATEQVFARCA